MALLSLVLVVAAFWAGGPSWPAVVLGLGGGAAALFALLGGSTAPGMPQSGLPGARKATPALVPDPALSWLRVAHDALGTWAIEGDGSSVGMSGYVSLSPGAALSDERLAFIEQRLLTARHRDGGGGERIDEGTLVFEALSGFVGGLLLKSGHSPGQLSRAHADLRHLLDGLTRRPIIHELANAPDQPVEAPGSIALRLAFHIERLMGGSALVALVEPIGVRIAAVAGEADRRLADKVVEDGTALHRVATGAVRSLHTNLRDLRLPVGDRRDKGSEPVLLLHLADRGDSLGAVALWPYTGSDKGNVAGLKEVRELLRQNEPRIWVARSVHQQQQESLSDPLTGLANRRALTAKLNTAAHQPGALIAVDVDRFKDLNDSLGHAAGDAALIEVARVLSEGLRRQDVAARTGGEEFAVYLPGASLAEGMAVAERLRRKLKESGFNWQGNAWDITASFGVSAVPETTRQGQNLSSQADKALYQAKRDGRDRVVAAPQRS